MHGDCVILMPIIVLLSFIYACAVFQICSISTYKFIESEISDISTRACIVSQIYLVYTVSAVSCLSIHTCIV